MAGQSLNTGSVRCQTGSPARVEVPLASTGLSTIIHSQTHCTVRK